MYDHTLQAAPKEPSRKQSLGAKRPRALLSGAAAVPVHQQQDEEEMDEEEGVYYMEEDDGRDVDYGDEEKSTGHRERNGGKGGRAVDDHAMRQRLEEFRMAKVGRLGEMLACMLAFTWMRWHA